MIFVLQSLFSDTNKILLLIKTLSNNLDIYLNEIISFAVLLFINI